ncbi:MAG: type II toxin-antitoxin system HicB family antitoxin [Chloroflexi bacterium]|nr:type II toxin-antitoxin system HicB family antitoxin [Chloroflexota bacterium]
MAVQYVLSDYVDAAMRHASYDELEDGSYVGTIPECVGVIAFGATLRACEQELQSTLEDWILLGFKLGHTLPVLDNIDLNGAPLYSSLESN